MLPVDLLIFLAAGQLHLRRVDDDDVIAGVDERRVGRLVLALQQPRGHGRDAAEHLAVGIDDVPAAARRRPCSALAMNVDIPELNLSIPHEPAVRLDRSGSPPELNLVGRSRQR